MKKFKDYFKKASKLSKETLKNKKNLRSFFASLILNILTIPLFIFKPIVSVANVNILKQIDRKETIDLNKSTEHINNSNTYKKMLYAWCSKALIFLGNIIAIGGIGFLVSFLISKIDNVLMSFGLYNTCILAYATLIIFSLILIKYIIKYFKSRIPLRFIINMYPDYSVDEIIAKSGYQMSRHARKILFINFLFILIPVAIFVACGVGWSAFCYNVLSKVITRKNVGSNYLNISNAFAGLSYPITILTVLLFSPRILLTMGLVQYYVISEELPNVKPEVDYKDIEFIINKRVSIKKKQQDGKNLDVVDLFDEDSILLNANPLPKPGESNLDNLENNLKENTESTIDIEDNVNNMFNKEEAEEQIIENVVKEEPLKEEVVDAPVEDVKEEVITEEVTDKVEDTATEVTNEEATGIEVTEATTPTINDMYSASSQEVSTPMFNEVTDKVEEEQVTEEVSSKEESNEISAKDLKPYIVKAKQFNKNKVKENTTRTKEINGRLKELNKSLTSLDKMMESNPDNVDQDVYNKLKNEQNSLNEELSNILAYVEKDPEVLAKELYLEEKGDK